MRVWSLSLLIRLFHSGRSFLSVISVRLSFISCRDSRLLFTLFSSRFSLFYSCPLYCCQAVFPWIVCVSACASLTLSLSLSILVSIFVLAFCFHSACFVPSFLVFYLCSVTCACFCQKIEGLQTLSTLQVLSLARNHISDLEDIKTLRTYNKNLAVLTLMKVKKGEEEV